MANEKLYRLVNVSDFELMINDISKDGLTLAQGNTSSQSFTEEEIRKSSDLQVFANKGFIKFKESKKALQIIDGEIIETSSFIPSPTPKSKNGIIFNPEAKAVMMEGTSDNIGTPRYPQIGDHVRVKGPNKFHGTILNFSHSTNRYEIKISDGRRMFADRRDVCFYDDPIFADDNYSKKENATFNASDLIKAKTLERYNVSSNQETRILNATSLINGPALRNAKIQQGEDGGVKEFRMSAGELLNSVPKAPPPAIVKDHGETKPSETIEESDDFSDEGVFITENGDGTASEVSLKELVDDTVRSVDIKVDKEVKKMKSGPKTSNDSYVKEFLEMPNSKQKMAMVRLTSKPKLMKLAKQQQNTDVSTMAYKRLNELGGSEE